MKRITKTQKQIFDAHLEAFKNDSFDNQVVMGIDMLREELLEGKTVESFWLYVWERSASITSQLMASSHTTGYISEKGKRDARSFMKHMLNQLRIE